MAMNRFGQEAQRTWGILTPTAVQELDDPEKFFTELGETAEAAYNQTLDRLLAQGRNGNDFIRNVARVEDAKAQAMEIVRADYLTPPEDEWEDIDADDEGWPFEIAGMPGRPLSSDTTSVGEPTSKNALVVWTQAWLMGCGIPQSVAYSIGWVAATDETVLGRLKKLAFPSVPDNLLNELRALQVPDFGDWEPDVIYPDDPNNTRLPWWNGLSDDEAVAKIRQGLADGSNSQADVTTMELSDRAFAWTVSADTQMAFDLARLGVNLGQARQAVTEARLGTPVLEDIKKEAISWLNETGAWPINIFPTPPADTSQRQQINDLVARLAWADLLPLARLLT